MMVRFVEYLLNPRVIHRKGSQKIESCTIVERQTRVRKRKTNPVFAGKRRELIPRVDKRGGAVSKREREGRSERVERIPCIERAFLILRKKGGGRLRQEENGGPTTKGQLLMWERGAAGH